MVLVTRGLRPDGTPCCFSIDGYLKKNLDYVIQRVKNKNWDYVGLVCGLPGAGKSNFAQNCARYCDKNFTEKNIAFTDFDFIKITNQVPEYSSVILDESFQSLNTRVTNSAPFLRIINHLQLIRQKHLFIFLCLPNFFDLSKGISIYRSSHMFLVYSDDEGNRGSFCVFDREAKRNLYIKGLKFMNYHVVKANFFGSFRKQRAICDKTYESMKRRHLLSQNKLLFKKVSKDKRILNSVIKSLVDKNFKKEEIAEMGGVSRKTVYNMLNAMDKK